MNSLLYYLRNVTPMHVGVGKGSGPIDLPVAREKATDLPMVPGSGIKGVLRAECEPKTHSQPPADDEKTWIELFGPKPDNASDNAGILALDDARLIAMPVRSLKGTCAWATSPFLLARYASALEGKGGPPAAVPEPAEDTVLASGELCLNANGRTSVMLDELAFGVGEDVANLRQRWAKHLGSAFFDASDTWTEIFVQRLVVVPDDAMAFFAERCTDVRARVRLGEDRTVAKNMLWYEENLPADCLLWGVLSAQRVRNATFVTTEASALGWATGSAKLALLKPPDTLQMGGKASVGRGVVTIRFEAQA